MFTNIHSSRFKPALGVFASIVILLFIYRVSHVIADVETGLRILNRIPAGEKIYYHHSYHGFPDAAYAVKPNGTDNIPILEGSILEIRPSLDGQKLLVSAGDTHERYSDGKHQWGPVHMHLWLLDEQGLHQLTSGNTRDMSAAWSYSGNKIYFARTPNIKITNNQFEADAANIWVMNPDGSDMKKITNAEEYANLHPRPTPDDKQLTFSTNRNQRWQIFIMNVDGTQSHLFIDNAFVGNWSSDGKRFAYVDSIPGNLYLADSQGRVLKQLTTSGRVVSEPSWSPDDTRIVYAQLNGEGFKDRTIQHTEVHPDGEPDAHPGPVEDIRILWVKGEHPPGQLTNEGLGNRFPYWSR